MPHFHIVFAGREQDRSSIECIDIAAARNHAVQRLGAYLATHPDFADAGHWRVIVEDDVGRTVATVIIATVSPRPAGS